MARPACPRHIPDASTDCLTCAVGNPDNKTAAMLLRVTESASATGVIAAVFAAADCEHANLVCIARTAIAEERVICEANDRAAREKCWHTLRRRR